MKITIDNPSEKTLDRLVQESFDKLKTDICQCVAAAAHAIKSGEIPLGESREFKIEPFCVTVVNDGTWTPNSVGKK